MDKTPCMGLHRSGQQSAQAKLSQNALLRLQKWPRRSQFAWQQGYGAFSVSRSNVDDVVRYIANQQEHHRKKTFQEEYVELLVRHGIEYDERYLWS